MPDESLALAVRMEARFDKLEKQLKDAGGVVDSRVKGMEDRFTALNKHVGGQFEKLSYTATSALGPIGGGLRALGPVGIGVGIVIGGVALALNAATAAAHELAQKAKEIRGLAIVTGLTTQELQALGSHAAKAGVDFDKVALFAERFTINLELLKKGEGELKDGINAVNPELTKQLALTKTSAEAVTVFGKALEGLSVTQRNLLLRSAGGRGAAELAPALTGLDVGKITAAFTAAGKGLDENLINKLAKLEIEIEKGASAAKKNLSSIFAEDVLQRELEFVREFERFSKLAKDFTISSGLRDFLGRLIKGGSNILGIVNDVASGSSNEIEGLWIRREKLINKVVELQKEVAKGSANPFQPEDLAELARYNKGLDAIEAKLEELQKKKPLQVVVTPLPGSQEPTIPIPQPKPDQLTARFRFDEFKNFAAILGDAITPAEQLKLKELELAAATEKNVGVTAAATRALTAFKLSQTEAALTARERIGIAGEEEIVQAKLARLEADRGKGFIKTAEEAKLAETIIRKEAKDTAEQLEVRASRLPQLTRSILDASNNFKILDQVATNATNSFADEFVNAASGTKTLKAAFTDLTNSVLRDIARMAAKKGISTILGSLLGIGGGGGDFLGGVNASNSGVDKFFGFTPANAAGTDYWRGGRTVVGEEGPEIVDLPKGSRIFPNDVSKQMADAAGGMSMQNNYDFRGAGVNVIPIVKGMLDARDRTFAARFAATWGDLHRKSVIR